MVLKFAFYILRGRNADFLNFKVSGRYTYCRGELSYLAPLGSENISAPYLKQCFFQVRVLPPRQSNTTSPSPKTEITNISFYILNFASIIKFKIFPYILPQQETKIKDYGNFTIN